MHKCRFRHTALAALLISLILSLESNAAMGASPQELYDDFALDARLSREYSALELRAYLKTGLIASYGNPEIKARLDQTALELLEREMPPFTISRLAIAALAAACLAACTLVPWLYRRREERTRPASQASGDPVKNNVVH